MEHELHTDVLVAGGGVGGLTAALTAASAGLSVLQIEKQPTIGGTTAHSFGFIWAPNALDPVEDPGLDDARRYMRFLSADALTAGDVDTYLAEVPRVLGVLASHGLAFEALDVPDHYFPAAPGSMPKGRIVSARLFDTDELGAWKGHLETSSYVPRGIDWAETVACGGLASPGAWDVASWPAHRRNGRYCGFGMALAGQLLRACLHAGVDLRVRASARRLLTKDGAVVGCVVALIDEEGNAHEIRVRANRGVVLATGGIEGDRELVMRFEDLPDWQSHFPWGVEGDGLRMAASLGGSVSRVPHNLRSMMGYRVPDGSNPHAEVRGAGIEEMAAAHTIVVNRNGERFADETSFQEVINGVRKFDVATHSWPNYPCFLIMDSNFFATGSFAGRPHGGDPPAWMVHAPDLRTLAAELGLPPARFVEEVTAFNDCVARGEADRYGRGSAAFSRVLADQSRSAANPNLGAVERGPFYAVPLVPTGLSSTSVDTDAFGRVLDWEATPVEGLFACGNTSQRFDRGPGYQAGWSLGQGLIMGHAVGEHLGTLTSSESIEGA